MKKIHPFLAMLLLLQGIAFGQHPVPTPDRTPGSKLYVFTLSGLVLRASADPNAEAIQVIPYGGMITVIENPSINFTVANIAGKWLRVKYDAKEGYAFDGFLSRLNPSNVKGGQLVDYIKKTNKAASTNTKPDDAETMEFEETIFTNGISYEFIRTEGGRTKILKFPKSAANIQELYLLAKVFLPTYFVATSTCNYDTNSVDCQTENQKSSLVIEELGGKMTIREIIPSF